MCLYPSTNLGDEVEHNTCRSYTSSSRPFQLGLPPVQRHTTPAMKPATSLTVLIAAAAAIVGAMQALAPGANAMPAPEVEYVYDVMVRRHYSFPNPVEALTYGYGICDKVTRGESYGQVMGDLKGDVVPNDEFAANYLVSYAVNLLCPAQIWQLRNSAAGYQPPVE